MTLAERWRILFVCLCLAALNGGAGEPGEGPRPRVGLVLGGGGALGFAHVGVLQVLEEMRIPIDYIGGTSMGAIIGGLYASGMSPAEIEEFLLDLNWWDVLNDHTPRRELEFRRKKDDQRYLLEFGWHEGGLRTSRGAAAGQKLNNVLQEMTLRTVSITNFDLLPVPYRAVATDLRSGKKVVLDHGNLATAMRASMAVPGVFTPVDWDDFILVDGGVADNIPVNVVRDMGADVLIAVDVGAAKYKEEDSYDYASMREVLARTLSLLQRPGQEAQLAHADLIVAPDVRPFAVSDFHRVGDIIPTGREAARALSDRLAVYRVDEEDYREFLLGQRRASPRDTPISEVVLTGNHRVDSRVARGRVRSRPGEPLDLHQVRLDLLHLYSLGEFEQVLFRVIPDPAGSNTLEYAMQEKTWGPNFFHVGIRLRNDFDQDEEWSVLLNYRKTSLNKRGAEWENEIRIGSLFRAFSEFYQPLNFGGVYFLAPSIEYVDQSQGVYSNSHREADYDVSTTEIRFDAGVQLANYAELRAGPFWRKVEASVATGDSSLPSLDENEGGLSIRLVADRFDRTLFPQEGAYFGLETEIVREEMSGSDSYEILSVELGKCFSVRDHTLELGCLLGTDFNSGVPEYRQFLIGGENSFVGLAEGELRGAKFGVVSAMYRYRLMQLPPSYGQGVYTVLRIDVGNVWQESEDVDVGTLRYGAGVGLGADTIIGPIYFGYGLADGGQDGRFYFSIGTLF